MLRAFIESTPHHQDGSRICLEAAPSGQELVYLLALCHEDPLSGHFSEARTLQRLQSAIVWDSMATDVRRFVRNCPLCQKLKAHTVKTSDLAMLPARGPLEGLYTDFAGPFPEPRCADDFKGDPASQGTIATPCPRYIQGTIDRFSHVVVLRACQDTSASTAARGLWEAIVSFGSIPEFVTTDGGPSFSAKVFADCIQELKAVHRISSPGHAEGHAPIERLFRDMGNALRALIAKGLADWSKHLGAVTLALNTAWSRALGTTPFEALHGFPPRLLVHQELGLDPTVPADDQQGFADPQRFSAELVHRAALLYPRVVEEMQNIHDNNARKWRERAKGRTRFRTGDFVLVHEPRQHKLDLDWRGPVQIVGVDPDATNVYTVADLQDGTRTRIHVNRLHIFHCGPLTNDQLKAEAARIGEFYIEHVHKHAIDDDGEIWFFVDWLGYPPSATDDPAAWVSYPDSHWAPAIKECIKLRQLSSAVRRRNGRLGPPPRA